jgi:hypothetical protein
VLNYADKENGQEVLVERINPPEELYDLGISELEMEEPSLDEAHNAVVKMRNNKAPGPDNIQVELIKYSGESLKTYIHQLVDTIWKEEIIPDDWRIGVVCPFHKKGDLMNYENYGGIYLLSTTYKILSNIIYTYHMWKENYESINVGFNQDGPQMIRSSLYDKFWKRCMNTRSKRIIYSLTLKLPMIMSSE